MRKRWLSILFAIGLAASSTVALASGWSVWTWEANVQPSGEPYTDICLQTGTVDVAKVEGNIHLYNNQWACSGTVNYVPSGWIRVSVSGYRDGNYCGNSGYYSNSSSAWGYGIRWQACSNPSGTQQFYGISYGQLYNGTGGYYGTYGGPSSPQLGY